MWCDVCMMSCDGCMHVRTLSLQLCCLCVHWSIQTRSVYSIVLYGGFLKWGYPQIIHFNRTGFSIINYKPSIFGYPHWWNPLCFATCTQFTMTTVCLAPARDALKRATRKRKPTAQSWPFNASVMHLTWWFQSCMDRFLLHLLFAFLYVCHSIRWQHA